MKRYVVLAASVILFVLVTSGNGDTTENGTVEAVTPYDTEEGNTTDKHRNASNIIHSVIENANALNLINIIPNPIKSVLSLFAEISVIFKEVGSKLPNLLFNPIALILTLIPHSVALALIAVTLDPFLVLPAKLIAFFFSILGLFSEFWAPFDKEYLGKF
jgi:hypothetical protein